MAPVPTDMGTNLSHYPPTVDSSMTFQLTEISMSICDLYTTQGIAMYSYFGFSYSESCHELVMRGSAKDLFRF